MYMLNSKVKHTLNMHAGTNVCSQACLKFKLSLTVHSIYTVCTLNIHVHTYIPYHISRPAPVVE